MWIAKVKISGENTLLGSRAIKYKISGTGYPLSYYKKGNHIFALVAGLIFGEEKNKKAFISDLKKSKDLVKLEVKKDFLVALIKQPLIAESIYDPRIIHIKPAFISSEGYEIYELASWDRKLLIKEIEIEEKYHKGQLLKLEEKELTNISVFTILPELTDKQKKALQIAVENGYYEYPKKIELKELAKLMGICYSTYQAHLKKAEKKIIPFMLQRL